MHGTGKGELARRYIVMRRRRQLNANGKEVLGTTKVSHCSHDPVVWYCFFPDGRDRWYLE